MTATSHDAAPTLTFSAWVEIEREALLSNVRTFRGLVGARALAAVVKGNAYGHGLLEVAGIIDDAVDWFAVNSLDEALTLHRAGHTKPTLIMGATVPERYGEVAAHEFRHVLFDQRSAVLLAAAASQQATVAPVHIEVETGTNRLGARPDEAVALARYVASQPFLKLEGLSTHYANVEDSLDSSYAEQQLTRFERVVSEIESFTSIPIKHSAASAAAMLYDRTHFGLVRMGIGLYGLWPSSMTQTAAGISGRRIDIRPALRWKTRIVHLNDVPMGEAVGYGCTYYVSQPRRIAVIPLGYYEGLDRGLSSRGPEAVAHVLVRGCAAPIVGRVSMNMTMIDVTRISGCQVGDEVTIIGRQGDAEVTAGQLADALGTINYEVVTRIGASLPRVIV